MATTFFMNSLPSPASSITALDTIATSPLPSGVLSNDARAQLQGELDHIRQSVLETQLAYNTAHASIPTYQQLVLTTHAQVAAAKQAVLKAKGVSSSSSNASSSSNSASPSNASSPPSPSSPLDQQGLQELEQEHIELGLRLSQVLRDKAEAEETKKRLNDYMLKAKSRIKELEQRLRE
ncbi:hypothetical protein BGZ82_005508 [Podila clonocystis]|nr:hypothetical protein BGZ82_005508 [Podila clonocystis]